MTHIWVALAVAGLIMCAGAMTGAEPGGEFAEEEYWAWVDKQIAARHPVITGPAGIEQGES